jgi:hypothetical protein
MASRRREDWGRHDVAVELRPIRFGGRWQLALDEPVLVAELPLQRRPDLAIGLQDGGVRPGPIAMHESTIAAVERWMLCPVA